MSPPRPSISPLSNAHTSPKASPLAQRMSAQGQEEDEASINAQEQALLDNDDKSSSLSDPESDDEEDEELERSHPRHGLARTEDVDSEAETERLDQTPRKMRDAVEGLGRTPSKLATVEHAEDELSDPPSPIPDDIGAASSTSTATGKKRKRSDTLESPLTSGNSSDSETKRKRSDNVKEEDDNIREDTMEVAGELAQPIKSTKGKKGKQRRGAPQSRSAVEAVESVETPDAVGENEAEDHAEPQVEDDPVRKSEAMDAFAQLAKQFTAFRETLFNERVASIDAELALLEQPRCQHPEYMRMVACVEQRRQKQDRETRAYHQLKQISIKQRTLGERSQLHSQYFQTVRDVRERALDELGSQWYAIHQERRQGVNYRPDESAQLNQYVDKRDDQLKQQAKYNLEVSILSGFAKYIGFPAAPEMTGVTGDALDDDLKAMKLIRRTQNNAAHANHQHHTHHHHAHPHPQTNYVPRQTAVSAASSERLAHEQFIEQHAWARAPQYSAHHTPLASTPNISHTPEWAGFRKPNHGASRPETVDANGLVTSKPFEQRDGDIERETTENAGQAARRAGLVGSSPLHIQKHRNSGLEAEGFRNYSGTSTIDAPLGDTAKDGDGVDQKPASTPRPEAAKNGTDALPRLSESTSTSVLGTSHAPTSLFVDDRPDMFRTAGFRPLDNNFATASGSVQSRT